MIEILQHHIDVRICGFEIGDHGLEGRERCGIEVGIIFHNTRLGECGAGN